jgi:hypothetical protein
MLVTPGTESNDGTRRNQAFGSLLIVEAESISEAEKFVKNDVYWTGGESPPLATAHMRTDPSSSGTTRSCRYSLFLRRQITLRINC